MGLFMMKKSLIILISTLLALVIIACALLYSGVIWFNNPSLKTYPVRGVDVSSYQGEIDWDVLSKENISFTFIKATEGSSFIDEKFKKNWDNSNETSLKVGAYHFFSYDSSGETQADNFISTVPKRLGMLPPVVDIEFYGDKKGNLPNKESTQETLNSLLAKLEDHYGMKPIIYATSKSYNLYIKDSYKDYPIWIRDVLSKPTLPDKKGWSFWQYSDHQKLLGYNGKEKFIDMNVFNGSLEEFNKLTK